MAKNTQLYLRAVLIILLLGWGSAALSADYAWRYQASGPDYTSPSAACEGARARQEVNANGNAYYLPVVITSNTKQTEVEYQCWITSGNPANQNFNFYDVLRIGDSCPQGTTYQNSDPNSPTCLPPEADPCESTFGQKIWHEHNRGPVDSSLIDPPASICEGACQYSNTWAGQKCYRYADGSRLDDIFCKFQYSGNGMSCTASDVSQPSVFDQPPSKPPTPADPSFVNDSSCDQWVTQPDGTAKRSCTSKETFKDPGEVDCSDYATTGKCTTGPKPPAYSDKEVSSETTKETKPDGSTKTDTQTTTDQTTCYGVKPCTSTSNTKNESSTTNPDGSPGDSSSVCTGDKCASGDDSTDPSKDPDEEEQPERTAEVGDCDAPVSCSGDAIDCALLKEQQALKCEVKKQGDFEAKKTDIESLFEGDKFQMESKDVSAPSFINGATRFLPSSCPPPESIALNSNGGHTFQLKYEPLCQVASDFSYLIVAFASLFAALYVGRAFGGE